MKVRIATKPLDYDWKPHFQLLPTVTSDGKHFVWLEYVQRRYNTMSGKWETKLGGT